MDLDGPESKPVLRPFLLGWKHKEEDRDIEKHTDENNHSVILLISRKTPINTLVLLFGSGFSEAYINSYTHAHLRQCLKRPFI